tara:strand:+ start:6969 stop:7136 length:168 start_codon:yes stop_codon:yes gene_type:complete
VSNIKAIYKKISEEGCKICNGKGWVSYFQGMQLVKEECYCQVVEEEYMDYMREEE